MKFTFVSTLFASLLVMPSIALALSATAELSINLPKPLPAVGEEFSVDVMIDTGGASVGGVGVYLDFSDSISFVSADESASVFDQEVLPAKADGGTVGFTQLRFDEGFNGADGNLASLTFERTSDDDVAITVNEQKTELIAFADSSNILKKTGTTDVASDGSSWWSRFVQWLMNLWPF